MLNPQTLLLNRKLISDTRRKDFRRDNTQKYYFLFKRFFDIVFSILFLVLVGSWFFPLLALLIKIDSRGPVFFLQKRVGFSGRSFNCLKFRTMVLNFEADSKQAEVDDYRITRIGHFLRNSSLDELPQFLNVLLGQMSVVGPRPHMHADCLRFSLMVNGYKIRNFVKPGITGLAQVKGFRGPTGDFGSVFHRYQYDAFYVRNCNFWLDMRIIRKTAAQTLRFLYTTLVGKKRVAFDIAESETNLQLSPETIKV